MFPGTGDYRFAVSLAVILGLSSCSRVETVSQAEVDDCKENCVTELQLHVPSPQWQDQIIYFLMIDRFEDGNPQNNDQGVGVYGKGERSKYNGGDLPGISQRLDYIQELGATTLWTTPQVANQWWDPIAQYWGYHGYWARDFKAVDEHYGTLNDYKQLSHDLHSRGMYLIQDIVVNHTGNFHSYDGEFDINHPGKNFVTNPSSLPVSAPTQAPFHQTDFNNENHRQADIYNWRPNIVDGSLYEQETTWELANLDDLNTKNPQVRESLKDSFNFWIRETGVDGVRIDTAKYVEREFYEDFLHSDNGLIATAAQTGREHFLNFGEILEMSSPYDTEAEEKIKPYLDYQGKKRIEAPIGFPLYKDIQNVFANGRPTRYLSYRLKAAMEAYPNPYVAVNFIDNHDVERFLAVGNMPGFKQAYVLLMTVPGIPAIYQGDEQGFTLQRQTMFAGGYGSETDQFNLSSQMYQHIQSLAQMRKQHKVFSRGDIQIIDDNGAGPGVLAYKRTYQGKVAYVIFNSADQRVLLNNLPTEFNESNQAQLLFSMGLDQNIKLSLAGPLTMEMPPRSALVLYGNQGESEPAQVKQSDIVVTDLQPRYENQKQVWISGKVSEPGARLLRVIDGRLADGVSVTAGAQGQWRTQLDVSELGEHQHTIEFYWPERGTASVRYPYQSFSDVTDIEVKQSDKQGDDTGPNGQYIKPAFQQEHCYMDLLGATARAGGSVLELSLEMCALSSVWGPVNGFDHLSFSIFFDIPGREGGMVLPGINSDFPSGNWDYSHVSYGWGNAMYGYQPQNHIGILLSSTPYIEVDKAANIVRFRYKGRDLGIDSWQGVKVYITTWDKEGDGAYKEITEEEGQTNWRFSGVKANSAKILDDLILQLYVLVPT